MPQQKFYNGDEWRVSPVENNDKASFKLPKCFR